MANRVAIVCAHLDAIRGDLGEARNGDDAPLDAVVTAARDGGELAVALEELHAALQAGGDALGLRGYAGQGAAHRGPRPAGIEGDLASGGQGGEITYVCPGRRCSRHWWPQGPAPVPHCAISGTALRRERL